MTLTSLSFFGFVLGVLVLYYLFPLERRWWVLLAASFAFYGIVSLRYMPFLLVTIASTYGGAIWMEDMAAKRKAIQKEHKAEWSKEEKKAFKNGTASRKKGILVAVLLFNFGILAALKYYNWLASFIGDVTHTEPPLIKLLLPLGISFYTFQTMGYLIDVYWEKTPAQRNLGKFALFASFFPQIIQGPIGIYDDLAHQLYEGHKINYQNLKFGFQLILWGLFTKMVVADRAIVPLRAILEQKTELSGFWNLLAVLIYSIQLYADFAGGINISRGVAEMLGIDMAKNFIQPYFSKSVSEFWRRWHATLGHWLLTYLFYPLAVSKPLLRLGRWMSAHSKGKVGHHLARVVPGGIATLITFMAIGMWHGASWQYAGFGIYMGGIVFLSTLLEPVFVYLKEKLKVRYTTFSYRLFQMVRTFILILIADVFDIADGLRDSLVMIKKCLTDPLPGGDFSRAAVAALGLEKTDWMIMAAGVVAMFCVSLYQVRSGHQVRETLDKQGIWFQWLVTLGLLFSVIILGMYGPGISANEFVYMQY